MKLRRSKIMTIFVLAGLMFGFLSFSTAPVAAQDTTSEALTETNAETAALPGVVFFVVRVAAWAAGYEIGTRLIGGGSYAENQYPADALDEQSSPF